MLTKQTVRQTILNHLSKVGSISIREAMDEYSISGGTLTKYITLFKREGKHIHAEMRKHPITGRRYARYHFVDVYKRDETGELVGVHVTTNTRNVYPFKAVA